MDRHASETVDPVCGVRVDAGDETFVHQVHGSTYHFCTSVCRDQFAQHPERYLGVEQDDASERSEGEAGVGRSSARSASQPAPKRVTDPSERPIGW